MDEAMQPTAELVRVAARIAVDVPSWIRGPATFEDDHVVLDLRQAERYQTAQHELNGLLLDLTAISNRHEVLGFVRRYGPLWHGPDETGEIRESIDEWSRVVSLFNATTQTVVDLAEALDGNDEARERLGQSELLAAFYGDELDVSDRLLAQASTAIAVFVSAGLRGVEESVVADSQFADGSGKPGLFGFLARPKNLEGYAWHELAMFIVNHEPMLTCPECGRFFVVAHGRQKFCSPRCAGRARYRRFAEKRGKASA